MERKTKAADNLFKYLLGLVVVLGLRLIPHPPNVEPIMATTMPFAKKWGKWAGLIFALLSVLSFDLLTHTLGKWSILTAGTYALIGAAAGVFLKNKKSTPRNYLLFAVVATVVYDALTGVGAGMLFFHQPFWLTLTGQIPFTLYHLAGNIVFSILISPLLYKWVVANPQLTWPRLWRQLGLFFHRA